MNDETVLPASEALDFLRRIENGDEIADPENGTRWMASSHTVIPLRFASGWELRVFKDGCGGMEDWDYIDSVRAPDGREHDSFPMLCPYDDDSPEKLAEWAEYNQSGARDVHRWTWRGGLKWSGDLRKEIGCEGVAETLPHIISTEETLRILHEYADRVVRKKVKRHLFLTPSGLPEELR